MEKTLETILSNAKEAFRESVRIENELLEEKLLSITTDTKALLKTLQDKSDDDEKNEIAKVYRKLPRWLGKKSQYNYRILKAFIDLSKNATVQVTVDELRESSGLESTKFNSHYSQMKNIFDRNHAKVFEEHAGIVELWKPVREFIIDTFRNDESARTPMTIQEAILKSLEETDIAMDANEILSNIERKRYYVFGAAHPISAVSSELTGLNQSGKILRERLDGRYVYILNRS